MLRIGVVGASGYAGGELIRILLGHPEARLTYVGSETYKGQSIAKAFPSLHGSDAPVCESPDAGAAAEKADLVFLAQRNGWATQFAPKLLSAGKSVVDFSADFRFRDGAVFQKWYKLDSPSAEILKSAVYGLPETRADEIKCSSLVANPGCYPTGAILALTPLLANRLIDPSTIIVDSKSGVSGAGRSKFELGYLFSELEGNLKPYNIGVHRHTPEIEQELSAVAGSPVTVSFTPHLVPMVRGILTTTYASLAGQAETASLIDLYRDFYAKAPFVVVFGEGEYPATKNTQGSNYCHIGLKVDDRTGRVVVVSAIDNLVKGAAGQAVQNMNIMCGLDERAGLGSAALYP
ncbi:MAG: N-acetyl-gamma-glutamyl-phosphate reductase [Armatimonadota bacterium]|nr:N-acetyl-gamma-glutamyl-phosphate reductase [Armatimonadota bacterium]